MYERKSVAYHCPCGHEDGRFRDWRVSISDYHPLEKEDIWNLLLMAHETDDVSVKCAIPVRLCQGVVGMQCPKQISGPIAEARRAIMDLFVAHNFQPPTPELVEEMFRIMRSTA